jgi:carbon monoxide dehydrogenase subunit G
VKLSSELRIAAPAARVWTALLDVPRVARALPGATIDAEPVDGAYRGTMKVKLGPVSTEYSGLARLQDVDEDERMASYNVQGREARGQGTAEATIRIRLRGDEAPTSLRVETELQVTGRQAQLGHGLMEEVAAGILREFAGALELALVQGDSIAVPLSEEAFDAGAAVLRPVIERAAILLTGFIAGIGVGYALRRR